MNQARIAILNASVSTVAAVVCAKVTPKLSATEAQTAPESAIQRAVSGAGGRTVPGPIVR